VGVGVGDPDGKVDAVADAEGAAVCDQVKWAEGEGVAVADTVAIRGSPTDVRFVELYDGTTVVSE